MRRLGEALGARSDTLMGLSGLGDLILTCGSAQSRNMSLGRALGQGQTLSDILGARRAVTEGVYTAAAVCQLADQHQIDMPISRAVTAILDGRVGVDQAIVGLLQRPLKAED
jgi:glycerol-3-phosphate dehydrogenase (NAD(P)+)